MIRRIALGAGLLLVVAGGYWLVGFQEQVQLGTGFIAKQMCSCMLVAERSFESCRPDQMPMMDAIDAELLSDGASVRAWAGFLAESVAHFDSERGCTLE